MEAQLTDVRAGFWTAVKPDAQFGRLGVGATLETRDDELASRLAVAEAELKGLKAVVDELRQARDARQGPTGRETRQMAIRWKQGLRDSGSLFQCSGSRRRYGSPSALSVRSSSIMPPLLGVTYPSISAL